MLSMCCIADTCLKPFLRGFTALKSLHYEALAMETDENFTPARLIDALECQADTLESLHIGFGQCSWLADADADSLLHNRFIRMPKSLLKVPSLAQFTKLKHLGIQTDRLGTLRNLPPNIETLCLRESYYFEKSYIAIVAEEYLEQLLSIKASCLEIRCVLKGTGAALSISPVWTTS
ncbi:hypothetical protein BU26DRAFT_20734 [Trematosphaeria pertusa]|uniref:L domain-like protein n=1 Tax=Trematosphaeria pertusa TaxID=390896 RepID=A0A6A6J1W4_9PLEO|nr:uncharacterized protein BU26DRAFT_20734 [Trematosphaeria pertusa]KAF2256381.1 hypothetical protein BU26DRAFT_20734 [Trematosphaeria pertusa]